MERRELLKMIALVTGSAFIGGEFLLSGCTNTPKIGGTTFTAEDIAYLDEVGDTILPKTSSPGAKETGIGKYMQTIVDDCYEEEDQKIFHAGIGKLDEASEKMHKVHFMEATPEQRTSLLVALDKEAKDYQNKKEQKDRAHYFTMMKQLTLHGYFTSKAGATQALRHEPVPGRYDGAFPYKKGDRAWAE